MKPTAGRLPITAVSQYFHPDFAATGQLLTELCVGLSERGCDVFVVTTNPNYGVPVKAPRFETFHGVAIRRVFSTQLAKVSTAGRYLNSLTFFASAFGLLLFRRRRGPMIIGSNPPFLGLLGCALKWLRGQPFVYLVNDVYPDIAVKLGYIRPDGLMTKVWGWINRLTLREASSVVVLSEGMRSIVMRNAGAVAAREPGKFHVIHNWVDETFLRPVPKAENWFVKQQSLQDKFVVLYSGNMGLAHDLEPLITAAERMRDQDIVFLFIGEGAKKPKLQELAAQAGLTNVMFLPYQSRDVFPYSVTCSDVSVVAMEKGIEGLAMPSKLYVILATGRPVLALVEEGLEVSRVVEEANCGRRVAPEDVDALVTVIGHYYRNRDAAVRDGENGRRYLEDHFTLNRACAKYHDLLATLS